jgi:hypothetical protein
MRSSAARSSASSASTSARRIESRAVAISRASAHPESVSVTCTVRRSAVPRARVTCPSASSWSTTRTTREWLSPRLQASRSIGLPDAKPASAATAAPRPPGPEADAAVAASTSRASTSTTAPSTFAVCSAAECMLGAYTCHARLGALLPRAPTLRESGRRGNSTTGRRVRGRARRYGPTRVCPTGERHRRR